MNAHQSPVAFKFNSNQVRTFSDDHNELWFVGSDVCSILGYTNPSKTIGDHCKARGVTKRYTPTEGGQQEVTVINEPNLYRLIIKSRKPEAEKFEEWVMEEVLPSIRRTGAFRTNSRTTISEEQRLHLIDLMYPKKLKMSDKAPWEAFNTRFNVKRILDLTLEQYSSAIAWINALPCPHVSPIPPTIIQAAPVQRVIVRVDTPYGTMSCEGYEEANRLKMKVKDMEDAEELKRLQREAATSAKNYFDGMGKCANCPSKS